MNSGRTVAILAAVVLVVSLPATIVLGKVTNKAADARCADRMPADAWGYGFEWKWNEFGFVCSYSGRDYRPTGAGSRVGLTDLVKF